MYLNKLFLLFLCAVFLNTSAQTEKQFNTGHKSLGIKLMADIPSLTEYEQYAYTGGFSFMYQYLYWNGASVGAYFSSVYSPGIRNSGNVKYRYITNAVNPMLYFGYDFRFFKKRLVQSVGIMGGYNMFMHYSNVKDPNNAINRSYTTSLGFLNSGFMAQTHYFIKHNWAIGLSYRYHSMPLTYYYSQNIELGIRYNFKSLEN